METYGALRGFADSWGVVFLVGAFLAVVAWVFRPGGRKAHDEAAKQIFRNEDAPKKDDDHGR